MMTRRLFIAVVTVILLLVPREPIFAAGAATTLAPDTITRMAREWLVDHLRGAVEPAAIEAAAAPRELALPAGEVAFNLTVQSGTVEGGAMTVLVEAVVTDARGARTSRSTTASFKVNPLRPVVVAVRELSRRTLVAASDVRVERRAASRVPAGAVGDASAVVGKETTRPVAPGEPLTASAVSAPLVIRRGSAVALVIEGPNFKIVARGVAAEDGTLGGPIRVVNQASRREVVGRVEDERTVRVAF